MTTFNKPTVQNPLVFRNTVGSELCEILKAHGVKDCNKAMGMVNLQKVEHLSNRTLKKIDKILGVDAVAFLSEFQKKYMEEKPRYIASYALAKKSYSKLKDVVPLLRGEFTEGYDILEDILDFFGVSSVEEIYAQSESQAALFRSQNKVDVDAINLYGWLRRGEIDFDQLNLPSYKENKLSEWINAREWEKHLEDVDYFKSLPCKFAGFGVGLIFVPSLPKTVYGAVRWIRERPLVQISDRGHDLVSCWFTLFHELGHTIKHKNKNIYEGLINDRKAYHSSIEKEANKFANTYLFHGDDLRKAVFERKRKGIIMSANALAEEFGVIPLLAAYWLLKAQYAPAFQRRIQIDFTSDYQ